MLEFHKLAWLKLNQLIIARKDEFNLLIAFAIFG